MSCTICGKSTGPGALLCRPCKAALKRARQFTVLEIPGLTPAALTMPGGLSILPPRTPAKARRPRPASLRALVAVILAVLLATAGTLLAVARFSHADDSQALPALPQAESPAPREPIAAPVEPVPMRVAPRPAPAQKLRVMPAVADATPPRVEPVVEAPAVATSTATPETPAAVPAVAAAPAPDRWQAMSDALARCAREGGLAGLICDQRTRLDACEEFWGRVPQCPLPPENPR